VFVTQAVRLCRRRCGHVEVVRPGDPVLVQADEEHRHGAAPDRPRSHLAGDEGDDDHAVEHRLTPVTDVEHAAAPTH
jgi:quercetin dioxygenase-like cupin family protein